ncbi:hypothetical protein [Planomicrobium okeanokoites]|uniref:hypothetical protein n=1 Tax=Planomicrobium okeanokoites TaxID=244 RepID=UPI0009FD0B95|nr:hypothetical protein [Planomicrobium okeanokoites]
MTKEEWIEIINMNSGRDWLDVIVIVVSIVSPILVLISVVFAAKSAMAAEKATNLNLKMYNEQKLEQEKSYYPIFEITGYNKSHDASLTIRIINRNTVPITNVRGYMETVRHSFQYDNKNGIIELLIFQNFDESNTAEFHLNYIALNHHAYKCNIKIAYLENKVFLNSQDNTKIN